MIDNLNISGVVNMALLFIIIVFIAVVFHENYKVEDLKNIEGLSYILIIS
jgi:hypothetical protein